jgi:hypothetical protein
MAGPDGFEPAIGEDGGVIAVEDDPELDPELDDQSSPPVDEDPDE